MICAFGFFTIMYYYLYHADLQLPKYSRLVMELETKFHKLGLEGQTTKLGRYASLDERIQEINFSNQDTLVMVGDDNQLTRTINLIGTNKTRPTIGYIPIGEETNITKNLGLPSGEEAVMVLANRRIETLDLGLCNDSFFIESIYINDPGISLKINNKFTASVPSDIDEILILNLKDTTLINKLNSANPHDGQLEIVFVKREKSLFNREQRKIHSAFKTNNVKIKSLHGSVEATMDHEIKIKTPLEIGVVKKGVKMIVGKKRLINKLN